MKKLTTYCLFGLCAALSLAAHAETLRCQNGETVVATKSGYYIDNTLFRRAVGKNCHTETARDGVQYAQKVRRPDGITTLWIFNCYGTEYAFDLERPTVGPCL